MKINIGPYPDNEHDDRVIEITIDEYDCYDLDVTLAMVILEGLKKFKAESRLGYPAQLYDETSFGDENGQLSFSGEGFDISDKAQYEYMMNYWDSILDKMIWSFEQIIDPNSTDSFFKQKPKFNTYTVDDMLVHEPEIHELGHTSIDMAGLAAHNKRVNEGLLLFAKYFQSLWD